jgi:hypothetical protein
MYSGDVYDPIINKVYTDVWYVAPLEGNNEITAWVSRYGHKRTTNPFTQVINPTIRREYRNRWIDEAIKNACSHGCSSNELNAPVFRESIYNMTIYYDGMIIGGGVMSTIFIILGFGGFISCMIKTHYTRSEYDQY